jgi:hypothetical protein
MQARDGRQSCNNYIIYVASSVMDTSCQTYVTVLGKIIIAYIQLCGHEIVAYLSGM